jgi:predicted Zn-dependent protease
VIGLIRVAYYWDWTAADAAFQRALAQDPGDVAAMLGAGRLAMGFGRIEAATTLFQAAVSRSPVSPEAHMWLGDGYSMSNRLEDAEREMRTPRGCRLRGWLVPAGRRADPQGAR